MCLFVVLISSLLPFMIFYAYISGISGTKYQNFVTPKNFHTVVQNLTNLANVKILPTNLTAQKIRSTLPCSSIMVF